MNDEERLQQLQLYRLGFDTLTAVLRNIPREAWSFKPSPEAWSIHEIILHLADAEAHGYIRFRTLIAEPGARVNSFDQNAWASALDYSHHSTDDALDLFRILRRTTYDLIATLPQDAWSRSVEHSTRGVLNLDDWLAGYDRHLMAHISQIERTAATWSAGRQGVALGKIQNGSQAGA
jgi:hypothetical protein